MRGYSLIELLIALAITAGLGALSMPLFKQQTESLLLQQASSRWLSYLYQVKAKAQRAEDNIMADLVPLEGPSYVFELATESTYSSTSPLIFYGVSGGAAPGHIRITNESNTVKVIISSKGRIRACVSHGPVLPGLSLC
ncbi:prepilin-type N-terminal cleavage/methylation domain-containing protein [Idiomarina sp. UBA4520]|uniref:prepilin-type N-terminal cleavage/methylation domain-containing protein n=1 Tax=Idiomarina sp. UBA4520 TaxID=1946647 RepID=UPI00257F6346|nr:MULTISPECIES: prepilin-type N-terminal cleavage/methylation domain-containing protein [unclassified Idiomarina]